MRYYSQALEIAHETGDRWNEGIHTANLGLAYTELGELETAIQFLEQALEISRDIGDRWGEGSDLTNLGLALVALGETEKGVRYHQQALSVFQEIGDHQAEGMSLNKLGLAYYCLGDADRARSNWERACEVLERFSDHVESLYGLSAAVLGLAITDPGWANPVEREGLLSPALSALQRALAVSAAPGMVREFMREHVWQLQRAGVQGLEPIAIVLERVLSEDEEEAGEEHHAGEPDTQPNVQ
jgi:tetratricopeptide (TPR) repeat protein